VPRATPADLGRGASVAHAWRAVYVISTVIIVYLNAFVAVTQAFLKIGFLHALAPTGKEPAFLIAQLVTLALFVVIGITAFRQYRGPMVATAS
jgi:hypothetical protein